MHYAFIMNTNSCLGIMKKMQNIIHFDNIMKLRFHYLHVFIIIKYYEYFKKQAIKKVGPNMSQKATCRVLLHLIVQIMTFLVLFGTKLQQFVQQVPVKFDMDITGQI